MLSALCTYQISLLHSIHYQVSLSFRQRSSPATRNVLYSSLQAGLQSIHSPTMLNHKLHHGNNYRWTAIRLSDWMGRIARSPNAVPGSRKPLPLYAHPLETTYQPIPQSVLEYLSMSWAT